MTNLANIKAQDIHVDADTAKGCLIKILSEYGKPSFGSMSKRDIDVMLFSALQDLGVIEPHPSIYEVMQKLQVTRLKARNLIYEAEIRRNQGLEALDSSLREILREPIFSKIGEKVSIEIDNPLLIDHLRYKLLGMHALTDGSFHAEIVTMTYDAFINLYVKMLPEEDANAIYNKFVALGVAPERGAKKFITAALKCIGHAALGKAGEDLMGAAHGIIKDWIHGVKDSIPNIGDPIPGTIYEQILAA